METKNFSCAETAKLIRSALKDAFKKDYPSVKFSVRSRTYSGGASIDIEWTDGPARTELETIAKQFSGAEFDGMQDLKTYHTSTFNGETVRFGADFIFCRRYYSRQFAETVTRQFCQQWGIAMLDIEGTEEQAYPNTNPLAYDIEYALRNLLSQTSAKDMHRAYEAAEEREKRAHEEWEAGEPEREAQRQREHEEWLKEEQKRQERREHEEHERQERARRQREQSQHQRMQPDQRAILASRDKALAYLGLSMSATQFDIMRAFRERVKQVADGQGGYTLDMDFLVKVKEKALA